MKIQNNLKSKIEIEINNFNTEHDCKYEARYTSKYLYFDRDDGFEKLSPICRLEFTGDIKNWEFAIYKYSNQSYDSEECLFPGEQYVNGTISGAMKAGLRAYE